MITSVHQKETTLPFYILTSSANPTLCPGLTYVKPKQHQGQWERLGVHGGGTGLGGGVCGDCMRAHWDRAHM